MRKEGNSGKGEPQRQRPHGRWNMAGKRIELELTIRLGKYLGSQGDIRIKHVKGVFIFIYFS